jgi:hypothetical protein
MNFIYIHTILSIIAFIMLLFFEESYTVGDLLFASTLLLVPVINILIIFCILYFLVKEGIYLKQIKVFIDSILNYKLK